MSTARTLAALFLVTLPLQAQHVTAPHASLVDVRARMALLKSPADPRVHDAIKKLHSCMAQPAVPAPPSPIDIPHHYLSGSHGPTNPAEREATRVYAAFEDRITAGMNQYLATGSHDESQCALTQLDMWAHGQALLNYDPKESSQAWYQVEWTLSSAGITDSVLVTDPTLNAAQQQRVNTWLDAAARKLIGFEKPGELGNNHHYWRALAAMSVAVPAADDTLLAFAVTTFKEAVGQIDASGAFPREMERHERATHYQGFALQSLVVLAEFAARQGLDLYAYQANGHTLRAAILFFGNAVDNPALIKPYTSDKQMGDYGSSDYAPFEFYVARFGVEGLSTSMISGLKHPTFDTRIGGSTTVLAAK